MSDQGLFFAKVLERVPRMDGYISMIVVGQVALRVFTEKDIVIYSCSAEHNRSLIDYPKMYKMVRFRSSEVSLVRQIFPREPPCDYSGYPWRKTTDWLHSVATLKLPIGRNTLVRLTNIPVDLPSYYVARKS
jgi:hypothetical protein